MTYRKLSTLPLDDYIKCNLSTTSLKTVKDVLLLSPLTLMDVVQLSADQCKEFRDYLFSLCVPPKLTAYEMEKMEQHNNIALGSNTLDALLHGGLLSGSLTEFVGPPGVGKTQWCLYITTKVLAMEERGGVHPSVIYIDTESAIRPSRIVEMMNNKYPELSSELPQYLSRIHVFRPESADAMHQILDSLECEVTEKDARVVIVDSIASLAVFLSNSKHYRASQLSSWAAKLKSLAHQLNICVVVTNQIITVQELLSVGEPGTHPQDQGTDGKQPVLHQEDKGPGSTAPVPNLPDHMESAVPALGNTWTHCVTTRLILQYTDSSARQILIAKSPVSPFAAFNYTITQAGITVEEKNCFYSYSGSDPGQFRIRVQGGIPLEFPDSLNMKALSSS